MNRFSNNAGAFHIDPVPSQTQIAHCHGFFVKHNMRRRGHGSILKELQMQVLKRLGYDFATCTVDSENKAQITILQQAGWRLLAEFANSKSGGKTQLWGWEVQ